MEDIKELGSAVSGGIHCLTIVGQVEGHQLLPDDVKSTKYEHVLPLLAAIEETPEIKGLLILLNTMGGDVEAGLAIAELIAGMKKPNVSLVLGGVSRCPKATLDGRVLECQYNADTREACVFLPPTPASQPQKVMVRW